MRTLEFGVEWPWSYQLRILAKEERLVGWQLSVSKTEERGDSHGVSCGMVTQIQCV